MFVPNERRKEWYMVVPNEGGNKANQRRTVSIKWVTNATDIIILFLNSMCVDAQSEMYFQHGPVFGPTPVARGYGPGRGSIGIEPKRDDEI